MEARTQVAGDSSSRTQQVAGRPSFARRLTTETKQAFRTTEFWAMVGVIVAILISAAAVSGGDGGGDQFIARQAWLYVAIVAAAYMISRGLAKAGSRDPYTERQEDGNRRS
jgi:hypothetical protein